MRRQAIEPGNRNRDPNRRAGCRLPDPGYNAPMSKLKPSSRRGAKPKTLLGDARAAAGDPKRASAKSPSPKPVSAKSVGPKPVSAKSVGPKSVGPKSLSPKPVSAKPKALLVQPLTAAA